MKISINSRTSGKFTEETINGRNHIVTSMMPIMGDTAMNKLLYPLDQVKASFSQLNNLPAPNGHPKVNGVHVSAFSPLAMNAFNVGGFIRNPKMNGKKVFTEFVIDETVANISDDGREIIRRIKENEKIGVSTGLNIDQVVNQSGTDDLGAEYTRIGSGFSFDHVAILLNEKAAGEHAGTEMVLNTGDKDDPIYIVNMPDEPTTNELSTDDIHHKLTSLISPAGNDDVSAWVQDIFTESKKFIYRMGEKLFKMSFAISDDEVHLIGVPVEVVRVTEFEEKTTPTTNQEDHDMDKEKFILQIIACTNNAFTTADQERLTAMSDLDLVNALCVEVDQAKAKEVLTANGFDFPAFENFEANQDGFKAYQEAEETKLTAIKESITSNSDYTAEQLTGKDEDELNTINSLIEKSKSTTRAPEGTPPSNGTVNSNANYDM